MSKRTIACPKCKKQYQVTTEMSGKKIKCPACQAVFQLNFKTPANQTAVKSTAAGASATKQVPSNTSANPNKPAARDYQEFGLDGPLSREAELFPEHRTPVAGQVVLDNYAADPGFGHVDPDRLVADVDNGPDNPLMNNPAMSHAQQLAMDIRTDKVQKELEEQETKNSGSPYSAVVNGLAIFFIAKLVSACVLVLFNPQAGVGLFFAWMMLIALVQLIFYVIYLVKAFSKTPTVDAVLQLFVPFYIFYFLYKHWQVVKHEATAYLTFVAIYMVGGLIFGLFIALSGFMAS